MRVVRDDWMGRSFGWDRKNRGPCHSRCGTIKIPPCSKARSAKHRPKFCSPSPAMVTFSYMWEILWAGRKTVNNQSIEALQRLIKYVKSICWLLSFTIDMWHFDITRQLQNICTSFVFPLVYYYPLLAGRFMEIQMTQNKLKKITIAYIALKICFNCYIFTFTVSFLLYFFWNWHGFYLNYKMHVCCKTSSNRFFSTKARLIYKYWFFYALFYTAALPRWRRDLTIWLFCQS
jgi:hypothetical protein